MRSRSIAIESESITARPGINPTPTQFPQLNAVLRELTERAQAILGDNFAGAYLQGSFAVGDADIASDCDFLIIDGRAEYWAGATPPGAVEATLAFAEYALREVAQRAHRET